MTPKYFQMILENSVCFGLLTRFVCCPATACVYECRSAVFLISLCVACVGGFGFGCVATTRMSKDFLYAVGQLSCQLLQWKESKRLPIRSSNFRPRSRKRGKISNIDRIFATELSARYEKSSALSCGVYPRVAMVCSRSKIFFELLLVCSVQQTVLGDGELHARSCKASPSISHAPRKHMRSPCYLQEDPPRGPPSLGSYHSHALAHGREQTRAQCCNMSFHTFLLIARMTYQIRYNPFWTRTHLAMKYVKKNNAQVRKHHNTIRM